MWAPTRRFLVLSVPGCGGCNALFSSWMSSDGVGGGSFFIVGCEDWVPDRRACRWPKMVGMVCVWCLFTICSSNPGQDAQALRLMAATHVGLVGQPAAAWQKASVSFFVFNLWALLAVHAGAAMAFALVVGGMDMSHAGCGGAFQVEVCLSNVARRMTLSVALSNDFAVLLDQFSAS